MTPLFFHFKKAIPYWSLIGFIASVGFTCYLTAQGLFGIALFGYFLFRNTLNTVQGAGPIYWITRDYEVSKRLSITSAFMREVDVPWRQGKGIQIILHKRSFQIGLCKKVKYKDDQEAQLGILGGRFMATKPTDIGNW